MATLEELAEMWKLDSEMDAANPHDEILKIPKLHSKYAAILTHSRLALKKVKNKYLKERKVMMEYYTGKLNDDYEFLEKNNLEPFKYMIKNDIDVYLDGDDRLIGILDKKIYLEEMVSLCESIIKTINNRSFDLNSYIKHVHFLKGVN